MLDLRADNKMHAVVDGLGNPMDFAVTEGQRNEITQVEPLLEGKTPNVVIPIKASTAMLLLPKSTK